MTVLWTLEQLKSDLTGRAEVKGWVLVQENVRRRERYFLAESTGALAIDQDRSAETSNLSVTLYVRLPQMQRQGEIFKKLFRSLPLEPQIASAIAAAQQTDHAVWDLPPAAAAPAFATPTADPRMLEHLDTCVEEMTQQIGKAVSLKRATQFNSAELFMSVHARDMHWSNGLQHSALQTRIYVEAAYSASRRLADGSSVSDEYLHTQWAVRMDDISVAALFQETSDCAQRMLDVDKPAPGHYPVIVRADVLATLFDDQISQLSAVKAYNKLPFIAPGKDLVAHATGDLLNIVLDPELPFGADSVAFSRQGLPQQRLQLVKNNQVLATTADRQYATYLGLEPCTVRGNVVVAAGTATHEELTRAAPQVIEILQFSGLFTDANSGTFSSEIRLARLYDNAKGTVRYLKGGSLSGAIRDNFKGLRLSSEVVTHAHFEAGSPAGVGYRGPGCALLSDVSIAG